MITKYFKKTSCESAEKVASNDYLITEILVDLPISSLLRFKSVSKHWLSLITSPYFSLLRIPHPLRPSGLFLPISGQAPRPPQYSYLPFDSSNEEEAPPFLSLTFPDHGVKVLQSCNGLLFCSVFNYDENRVCKHYVCNPTIRQFTTIPLPPSLTRALGNHLFSTYTTLAFDPSRSPHYNLILPHKIFPILNIMVYSSETQVWSDQPLSNPPTKTHFDIDFTNGVYLNGAVHWISYSHTSIYFKIDEERLETIPMPLISENHRCIYFGQSGGRLHLITANDKKAAVSVFDVYEMEKDYSEWCVRYQVVVELREMHSIKIMGIVRGGEREEDSFLVFKTLEGGFFRFMKYKFADKTLNMLFEIVAIGAFTPPILINNFGDRSNTFEFIQSLSPV